MSFQSPPPLGKLAPALAFSILLHILLLWPDWRLQAGADLGYPLVATLRATENNIPARVWHPPAKHDAASRREIYTPPSATLPAIATIPPPQNISNSTVETAGRSDDVAKPAPGPAPGAAPGAVPGPAGDARPAAAAVAPAEGLDADGVRQYSFALAVAARRYRYAAAATVANMGGTVEVRVAVGSGGLPPEVALARSSGSDLLDAAALEMMRRAAPGTTVPERLRGRAFAVSLPVVFDPDAE